MTQATPRPWRVEQDGDGKFIIVAPREHDNLLITGVLANLTPGQDEANAALFVRAVNSLDPLMEALAWALPYAKEHAEQGSQCCGAPEHGEAEGICTQCHEHTGFDNPDLEDAEAALLAAEEETG